MTNKTAGPYFHIGTRDILGKDHRTILTVHPFGDLSNAETDALISDLIDFLTQRDKERASATAAS